MQREKQEETDTRNEIIVAAVIAVLVFPLFLGGIVLLDWLDGPPALGDTSGLGTTLRGNPDRNWQARYYVERREHEEREMR